MADEELALEQQEGAEEEAAGGEDELSAEEKAMARLKEAVQVEREDLGGLRLKLKVTVPRDILDERFTEQYSELRREALIPGFRKGHAPIKLVEKRFAADVGEELKGKLVGSGYLAAVEKLDIKPLGDPHIWVKVKEERSDEAEKPRTVEVEKLVSFDKALDYLALPKDGPLSFTCELELTPQFELPQLAGIPLERPAVKIKDEDVGIEVTRMQQWYGTYQPVEGGPIERNDMLYSVMKMTVEGQQVASNDNYDLGARDMRVEGVSVTGLGDALVGKSVGDTVAIDAKVPDDHERIDLRGKTASFEFTISEIKRLIPRPLDAEFLSSMGYESEDDLRKSIRGRMEAELDSIVNRKLKEQIGEWLVKNIDVELPSGLSQRQTERSVARRMMQMYQDGIPQGEIEQKVEELRSTAHDQVIHDLKLYFILDKIAGEREIEVEDEEMNGAIAQVAARTGKRFDRVRDELSKGEGMMNLYMRLRDDKVLDALLETAEIKEVEGPPKKAK